MEVEDTTITRAQINETIVRLNNLYGRGDVRRINHFADGRSEVTAHKQYGVDRFAAHTQLSARNGLTVFARGHQMTIKPGK
jgi:hypothetical protein